MYGFSLASTLRGMELWKTPVRHTRHSNLLGGLEGSLSLGVILFEEELKVQSIAERKDGELALMRAAIRVELQRALKLFNRLL
jgi:hypothetical protein